MSCFSVNCRSVYSRVAKRSILKCCNHLLFVIFDDLNNCCRWISVNIAAPIGLELFAYSSFSAGLLDLIKMTGRPARMRICVKKHFDNFACLFYFLVVVLQPVLCGLLETFLLPSTFGYGEDFDLPVKVDMVLCVTSGLMRPTFSNTSCILLKKRLYLLRS